MKNLQSIISYCFILLILTVPANTFAQATTLNHDSTGFFTDRTKVDVEEEEEEEPIDSAPGFGDDVPDTIPVDGGLSLLVAAGVGYGVKKLRDRRKK